MKRSRKPKVCVASGGPSGESDVSRVSASAVCNALIAMDRSVIWADLSPDGQWSVQLSHSSGDDSASWRRHMPRGSWKDGFVALLEILEIELVFPVIHGVIGEDGQLQTLCASISVPYVGSDPEPALRCYDKAEFKRIVAAAGLPTVHGECVERASYEVSPEVTIDSINRSMRYPCIVKPSRSGSSLGLSRVESSDALTEAVEHAFDFDDTALVEELCTGSDVEIGVLGSASPTVGDPIAIRYDGQLYDFSAKYRQDDALEIPAPLSARVTAELVRAARVAFTCTGCRGLGRVDFLVDSVRERYVVNELNTAPFMTAKSSFAESLKCVTAQPYEQLVASLADLAWSEHRERLQR